MLKESRCQLLFWETVGNTPSRPFEQKPKLDTSLDPGKDSYIDPSQKLKPLSININLNPRPLNHLKALEPLIREDLPLNL